MRPTGARRSRSHSLISTRCTSGASSQPAKASWMATPRCSGLTGLWSASSSAPPIRRPRRRSSRASTGLKSRSSTVAKLRTASRDSSTCSASRLRPSSAGPDRVASADSGSPLASASQARCRWPAKAPAMSSRRRRSSRIASRNSSCDEPALPARSNSASSKRASAAPKTWHSAGRTMSRARCNWTGSRPGDPIGVGALIIREGSPPSLVRQSAWTSRRPAHPMYRYVDGRPASPSRTVKQSSLQTS